MKRRRITAALCGAFAIAALAACGTSSTGGTGQQESVSAATGAAKEEEAVRDELVFVNYRDIRDLNPHLYAGEMYAQSILYDTLVSNTEEGYVGCLAKDWTISEDGRVYTFHIREGVQFSDGTPCDANAILANFNAILQGASYLAGDDEPAGWRIRAGSQYLCDRDERAVLSHADGAGLHPPLCHDLSGVHD